jgi:hypothetical protein
MSRRRSSGPETDEVSRGLFTVRRERRRSKDFGGSGTREMARNPAVAPGAERYPRTLGRGGGWPGAARRAGRSKVLAATARKGTSLHGTTRLGLELEFTTPAPWPATTRGGSSPPSPQWAPRRGSSSWKTCFAFHAAGGAGHAAVPLLRPSAPRTRSHAGDVRGQPPGIPRCRRTPGGRVGRDSGPG